MRRAAGADDKAVTTLLKKAGDAIDNIFKTVVFIKTLIKAIGKGFTMFKEIS